MPTLILASRNAKKIGELRDLLAGEDIDVGGLDRVPAVAEIEETGSTFAENAAIKATTVATAGSCWAIGEDSGLCVDALDGRPGLYSARYAGEHGNGAANNSKLVTELADVPGERRTARYRSAIAVADPTGEIVLTSEGECRGLITLEPRGSNGFGYDPHFVVREYHRTFGELPAAVKRAISHRARAMRDLLPKLTAALRS